MASKKGAASLGRDLANTVTMGLQDEAREIVYRQITLSGSVRRVASILIDDNMRKLSEDEDFLQYPEAFRKGLEDRLHEMISAHLDDERKRKAEDDE